MKFQRYREQMSSRTLVGVGMLCGVLFAFVPTALAHLARAFL